MGGGTIGIWAQLAGLELCLEVWEDTQKIIFEGDSKTTNPVVRKSYDETKNN